MLRGCIAVRSFTADCESKQEIKERENGTAVPVVSSRTPGKEKALQALHPHDNFVATSCRCLAVQCPGPDPPAGSRGRAQPSTPTGHLPAAAPGGGGERAGRAATAGPRPGQRRAGAHSRRERGREPEDGAGGARREGAAGATCRLLPTRLLPRLQQGGKKIIIIKKKLTGVTSVCATAEGGVGARCGLSFSRKLGEKSFNVKDAVVSVIVTIWKKCRNVSEIPGVLRGPSGRCCGAAPGPGPSRFGRALSLELPLLGA